MTQTLRVTVTADQATALPHPSCRPLVLGLLAVLDDPALGADPTSTRHAWVDVELRAPIAVDVPLPVTATAHRTARLGSGDGVWIDVDVAGPDGAPLVRSRHVVAATLAVRPEERGSLPNIPRPGSGSTEVGRFNVDAEELAAYRAAAGDTSDAHAGPSSIVPGLLALWSAIRAAALDPTHVEARFAAPLPLGTATTVVADDSTFAVEVDGRTVLRARQ